MLQGERLAKLVGTMILGIPFLVFCAIWSSLKADHLARAATYLLFLLAWHQWELLYYWLLPAPTSPSFFSQLFNFVFSFW